MKNKTLLSLLPSLLLITMFQATNASQADIDKDIQYYVGVFSNGSFTSHRVAMDQLEWAGMSSTQVYDLLADKVSAAKTSNNKEQIEAASWYAKALAFSGNEKYRALMSDVSENAKSSKLQKYTKKSLARLENYIVWNPIISANLTSAPTGRLEEARIENMLSSNNLELGRLAAKRVYYAHSNDSVLIASVVKRLDAELKLPYTEDYRIDTIAWLMKAIGNSKNLTYKPLLQNIKSSTNDKKIKKYAKKALANY